MYTFSKTSIIFNETLKFCNQQDTVCFIIPIFWQNSREFVPAKYFVIYKSRKFILAKKIRALDSRKSRNIKI